MSESTVEKSTMLLNVTLPILAGGAIYLMLSSDVIFIQTVYDITGIQTSGIVETSFFLRIIRFYLPDMLWGYSLLFSLIAVSGCKDLKAVFILSVVFMIIMECTQMHPSVPGTFDPWDIVAEIAALTLAVFIINKLKREEKINEN